MRESLFIDLYECNASLIFILEAPKDFSLFRWGVGIFGLSSVRLIARFYFICEVIVVSIVLFATVVIFQDVYLFAKNVLFLGRSYLSNFLNNKSTCRLNE